MNKKSIYIVALVSIGLLFIYTTYSVYAINFWTHFPESEKLNENELIRSSDVRGDIAKAAREYNVDFFVYRNQGNASTETNIQIYATSGACSDLKRKQIESCDYSNPVTGNIKITVLPVENIDKNIDVAEIFYTGNDVQDENIQEFSKYLSKRYGFSPATEQHPDIGLSCVAAVLWGIIFGVLLSLFYYDVICSRKENAVIVLHGGNIIKKSIKLIISYIAPMYVVIVIYCIIVLYIGIPLFGIKLLVFAVIGFSLLISLMQLIMSPIDFKRDLSNATNVRKLIKMNWGLRISTTFVCIIIVTIAGTGMFRTLDLEKQRPFYKEHEQYNFYMIYDEENENQGETFYKTFADNAIGYQKCLYNEPELSEKCPIVFVNRNAITEMASHDKNLAEIVSKIADSESYVLVSRELNKKKYLPYIGRSIEFFGLKSSTTEMIEYDFDISVMLLDDMLNNDDPAHLMQQNPVIVAVGNANIPSAIIPFSSSNDTMYKTDDNELKEACKKHGWDFNHLKETSVNVYEGYTLRCNQMKSVCIIGMFFSIMLLVTQILASLAILKLQYRINSVEMVLMKITGYNTYKRVKAIINNTIVTTALWVLAGIVWTMKENPRVGIMLCLIGIVILCMEVTITITNLRKADAENMVDILKGGVL